MGEGGEILEFDVLTCRCGSIPVVAGIPIFIKGNTTDKAIALIQQSRHDEALLSMLAPSSPSLAPAWLNSLTSVRGTRRVKHLAHWWALRKWRSQLAACLTACDFLDFYLRRSGQMRGDAYDYFAFRFGQPRHLVALSFASLIHQPTGPILDLACGCGHITHSLIHRSNGRPVVGVDRSFFALFVARNWIAPDADYICCAADAPLPFPDHVFSAVFCTDGFHYLADKVTAIREAKRVTQESGIVLLNVLRNAQVQYRDAGQPLSPEGYQALVDDMPHCMVADTEVLDRYLHKQGPALERPTSLKKMMGEPLLSLVASKRREIFQDHGSFEDWPHAEGCLRLNPLYTVEENGGQEGSVLLRLQFPGAWYEQDNAECKLYLPEKVRVSSEAFEDLSRGRRTPEIEALIGQCVVLGMPQRYASDTISSAWAKLAEYGRLPGNG
jgi:ubiquinone/menaquinone biosynthesis C-methylase UbiE